MKTRISDPVHKLSLEHSSSAPSKLFARSCQSWADNVKQESWQATISQSLEPAITRFTSDCYKHSKKPETTWHFLPHSYNAIPVSTWLESSCLLRAAAFREEEQHGEQAYWEAQASTQPCCCCYRKATSLGCTWSVLCSLHKATLWSAAVRNLEEAPFKQSIWTFGNRRLFAFLSESFPVGSKGLGNHNYTHLWRPYLLGFVLWAHSLLTSTGDGHGSWRP